MIKKIENDIKDAFDKFKDHRLIKVEDTDQVKIFALVKDAAQPDQWFLSTRVIFHKGLIAITGDYRPGSTAATCCLGYGVDWFMSDHHWQYLASKFLQKSWQPDVLQEKLLTYADQVEHDAQVDLDCVAGLPSVDATFELGEFHDLIVAAERAANYADGQRVGAGAVYPHIRQNAKETAARADLAALDYLQDRVTDQDEYDEFDHDEYAAIVAHSKQARSDAAKLRSIAAGSNRFALENWGDFQTELHDAEFETLLVDTDMISMGHDYDPAAVMWLCGIQRAFAAKYAELEAGG